jgi:hypothetical protein
MHQMRISTNKVSSVVLGPEKVGSPKKGVKKPKIPKSDIHFSAPQSRISSISEFYNINKYFYMLF